MADRIVVRKQTELKSKQWGIYLNGKLHEGGFFSRDAAEDAAGYLEIYLDNERSRNIQEEKADMLMSQATRFAISRVQELDSTINASLAYRIAKMIALKNVEAFTKQTIADACGDLMNMPKIEKDLWYAEAAKATQGMK